MGLSVGPSDVFPLSWLLRAGTARGPFRSLMQPCARGPSRNFVLELTFPIVEYAQP